MSLRSHYQRGALQALADAGIVKHAAFEVTASVAEVAYALASAKARADARNKLRAVARLEAPEWRESGELFEIPELAAQRAKEQLSEAWNRPPPVAPEPEEAALPVVKIELPAIDESRARAPSLP